jgi:hypothetical protein
MTDADIHRLTQMPDKELIQYLKTLPGALTVEVARSLLVRLDRLHAAVDDVADDVGRYTRGDPQHPLRAAMVFHGSR